MTEEKKYELMGYWLSIDNRYDMVETYNSMLDEYESTVPPHDELAYRLHQIAVFFFLNARYEGAEPLYRRALVIREKVIGKENPDTAETLNMLSWLLASKGDYGSAELLDRRILAIYEKVLGREHPDTATSLNNLACLLDKKGDYEGAEPLHRRALAIREKVLGKEHPDTAGSLDNLAALLYSKGDYAGALPLCRRALAIYEKVLGMEHPDTAGIINNLAELLRSNGDYVGAEPLSRRALAIREKMLGKEHSYTATSLNNLAVLFNSKGDYAGAEPLLRRALAIREKVLGKEHPDTAGSLDNLASLLHRKGDSAGAESLHRRALAINEKALGKTHPDTVLFKRNLRNHIIAKYIVIVIGYLFIALGVFLGLWMPWLWILGVPLILFGVVWGVITVYPNVGKQKINFIKPFALLIIAIKKRLLGNYHPNTIQTVFNMAQLLRNKGDHKGAAPLYRQLIEVHEELLKKHVPILPQISEMIAISNNNLAFDSLVPVKNWKDAKHHYQKAIELFNKVPDPVQAANSELNLQTVFHLSGQTVDIERVKALTRILEEAGDKRAEKGHKILNEISK